MTREHDWAGRFWALMLPICWVLSPTLGVMAHWEGRMAGSEAAFQTTLYMSIFLAMFGLVAMRILIGRAMDQEQTGRAAMLGAVSVVCSVALIAYGLSTMG